MASKKDAAAELAEELVRQLEALRRVGPPAYPLSVGQLMQLIKGDVAPELLDKALGKRSFQQCVVVARARNRQAPIALASDVKTLAASRQLLEFMLKSVRTPTNHAF